MARHQSGIRQTPIATARTPEQKFLARCLDACLARGIGTRNDLARLFPDCKIQAMCGRDDFCVAMLNAATPLTVTPEQFEQHRDHYLLLIDIAVGETHRLSYRDMVRAVPVQTLAVHAEGSRLWAFVAQTAFWTWAPEDPKRPAAEQLMADILRAALESHLLEHDELVRCLRAAPGPLLHSLLWRPIPNRLEAYCLSLVDAVALDILHSHILAPLVARMGWEWEGFLQEEIPTNPDLKVSGLPA